MVAFGNHRAAGVGKRMLFVALAVAAGALLAAPVGEAHVARYPTSSSFGYAPGTTVVPDAFLGQVSSSEPACLRGRSAVVFRRRGGPDARVGADRTSTTGQWIIEKARVRRGRYYLKVPAKRLRDRGHRHTCKAYRSSTLRFGD